ncbi:MAG: hypothetical protein MI919_38755 [Holophagales bacterium]|nr:hypothetical protein [Holophagales bacterium]
MTRPHGPPGEGALPAIEEREHGVVLDEHPAAALNLLAGTAEKWGALWQKEDGHRGRLGLPVSAGIRQGWVAGPVKAEALDGKKGRCRLSFTEEVGEYQVDRAAVMVLSIAGFAGVATLLAPFFPRLWPFVPLGFVLGLAAWLMVVARLRNSGPEDFLQAVADEAGPEPAEGPEAGRSRKGTG